MTTKGKRWKRRNRPLIKPEAVFRNMTVLEPAGKNKSGLELWLCRCTCGFKSIMTRNNLLWAKQFHCRKCAIKPPPKPSKPRPPTFIQTYPLSYRSWTLMLDRCYDPKHKSYKTYGARGITVCDRWRTSFSNFVADMGERPEGLTLERVNNDGDYRPSNCCWTTRLNQNHNRSNNFFIIIGGETRTESEWSKAYGFCKDTLGTRRRVYGDTPDEQVAYAQKRLLKQVLKWALSLPICGKYRRYRRD
jgi:hypothetical protein